MKGYSKQLPEYYEDVPEGSLLDFSLGGVIVTARRVLGGWELRPSPRPIPSYVLARGRSRPRLGGLARS